jgi:Lrp/AsnC family leucine-responsive transcriptional regulator
MQDVEERSRTLQNVLNDKAVHPYRTLDTTDQQIVRLLHTKGRLTHERISREVSLSRPAVHERIKRLEESGVIEGYQAQIDWHKVGQSLTLFIWVSTSGGVLHSIAEAILRLSNSDTLIEECHLVTGEWCLMMKVRTVSTTTLQHLLDRLREMPRVRNTMTMVVLSSAGEAYPEDKTDGSPLEK